MVLVVLVLYGGTLAHKLVWDDLTLLTFVDQQVGENGVGALLSAKFVVNPERPRALGYYRPVVLLSLWADSRLSGLFSSSYHLTNVLLHALNAVLVLLLLRRLLRSEGGALGGALLFALHPVQVESVAFVSARTDLWAAAFTLAAALLWLEERTSRKSPSWLGRAGSVMCFALAVLSKESALMLPVVLLAWDVLAPQDLLHTVTPVWWRRNRFWIVAWAMTGVFLAAMRWGVAGVGMGAGTTGALSYMERGMVWEYLRFSWVYGAAALLCLGLFLAVASRRSRRLGLLGLVWTGAFLLPVSGIVPLSAAAAAERYLYLPSVGLCVVLGALLERLASGAVRRRTAYGVGIVLLLVMGTVSFSRSRIWRDELSLYSDLVRTSPGFAEAHYNLGIAYAKLGRDEEAAEKFRTAIRIMPEMVDAYIWLGNAYGKLGRYDFALDAYRQAVRIKPDSAGAHFNLALHHLGRGKREAALAEYQILKRIDPVIAERLQAFIRF